MGRRHYKVEEIIHKLCEAEVHIANGKSVVEAEQPRIVQPEPVLIPAKLFRFTQAR